MYLNMCSVTRPKKGDHVTLGKPPSSLLTEQNLVCPHLAQGLHGPQYITSHPGDTQVALSLHPGGDVGEPGEVLGLCQW